MIPRIYPSIIYNLIIFSNRKNTKIFRKISKEYYRLLNGEKKDIPILTRLNRHYFFCPFSHKLLFYQKEFPLYDKQLPKLCHFLQYSLNKSLNIIDVGANIGDTVLNIGIKDAFYLCIEGNPTYTNYIKSNLRRYNYTHENVFLSDSEVTSNYNLISANGTGRLIHSENANDGVKLLSLDKLLNTKYSEKKIDIIKIDTDGFDFKVIRGAKQCLQKWQPIVFFEWDRAYCIEQGEDPLSIFHILDELGYHECILFDNYGNLFDKVDTNNKALLKSHIKNTIGDGLPYYYDVLAIPDKEGYNAKEIFSIF